MRLFHIHICGMDKTEKIFKVVRHSINSKHWNVFKTHGSLVTTRHYCKEPKEVDKFEDKKLAERPKVGDDLAERPKVGDDLAERPKVRGDFLTTIAPPSHLTVKLWNENAAIKTTKRESKFYRADSVVEYMEGLQRLQDFPGNFRELSYYLERREVKKQMLEQKYLPRRHEILKPDLATSHFLLRRGGQIKFMGNKEWVGGPGKVCTIPMSYVPGLYVEKINAEGTDLYYEGLKNLCDLQYLSWLSFKGLKQVNDWWLDWVSKEYYDKLSYLDISGCKHVTYRGLSCFYRFERLKTLKVEDVSSSPEFKLACLMLLDVFPDLEILGIDLIPPDPIDPLDSEVKQIRDNRSSLTKE